MPKAQISAASFVETVRVNVDNEKLSDEEFRKFIRQTLPIVESTLVYTAEYEFSVCGYQAKEMTFKGSLDSVKEQIDAAHNEFVLEIEASNEKNGDLRDYMPQFADGYLSIHPGFAQLGEDYDIILIEVYRSDFTEPLIYDHAVCQELRARFGG